MYKINREIEKITPSAIDHPDRIATNSLLYANKLDKTYEKFYS